MKIILMEVKYSGIFSVTHETALGKRVVRDFFVDDGIPVWCDTLRDAPIRLLDFIYTMINSGIKIYYTEYGKGNA